MSNERRSRLSLRAAAVIAFVVGIVGASLIVVALQAQQSAPQPAPSAAGRIRATAESRHARPQRVPAPVASTTRPGLQASPPIAVSIPSIGVSSHLLSLGRNADGTVQVPDSFHIAGWYNGSVTPGQLGPTVILGHVDSTAGPGIFFRLGALHPGDQVSVNRLDGSVVTFTITGVREYPKNQFPTLDVYADTPVPTIRLITCGGAFDRATQHYVSNIVAFGQLT